MSVMMTPTISRSLLKIYLLEIISAQKSHFHNLVEMQIPYRSVKMSKGLATVFYVSDIT